MKDREDKCELLRRAGLRATPQRLEILSVLAEGEEARTTEEVYRRCRTGATNLSTVYRTLSALCQKGLIKRVMGADGLQRYYAARGHHRHQVVCVKCGHAADLPGCPVEELERLLELDTGYAITAHCLELEGLCPGCRER